ncbi:MAG: recombinase family protein [bacterium]|nr:recombinase family protein [bacterium]
MLIGYARVSTEDQKLDLQRDALLAAGCERIFAEKIAGAAARLPVRDEMLDFARDGDVIVVWRLDRFSRSLRDLVVIVTALDDRGVGLRSLRESLDTTTPAGTLVFHVFSALAEFESALLREHTRAGLAAAAKRGSRPGRPRSLSSVQVEMARSMMANPELSAQQLADELGVHRSTLYRAVRSGE